MGGVLSNPNRTVEFGVRSNPKNSFCWPEPAKQVLSFSYEYENERISNNDTLKADLFNYLSYILLEWLRACK